MDRISDLPKDISQRILYFLSQEDAVRTSVLSKSWRDIWCTRPNLDFIEDSFHRNKQQFLSAVDTTLQRYCDQRLSLEKFHLSISVGRYLERESVSLLEKWIPLTATGVKELRLSIRSEYAPGFIELPLVVFETESLQHLRVEKFRMNRDAIPTIVLSKHLKKLHLQDVYIEDNVFQKITSSCPLIEAMVVDSCRRLKNIRSDNLRRLKNFFFKGSKYDDESCSIEIYPPSLETIEIIYGNVSFHKGADFHNLNYLHLSDVKSSLDHLSSFKFPSLERLNFLECGGLKESDIFIDAPNILYFKYEGDFIPSISFATTTTEWKSDIQLKEGSLWFLNLNELLKSLSQSEISLIIDHADVNQENIPVQDNGYNNNKPFAVESLGFHCHLSSFPSLLNAAFCICRPRIIGYHLYEGVIKFVGFMWKILMERGSGNEDELTQLLFRDLEEASFEVKERDEEEWRRAPLSEFLLNYQTSYKCRFALKWR
ncbi:hypothetical protein ABFS82_05G051800 [Erythranthe guttata]|nr:PREDICTED: FBD-associated F-box protein At3g52670-like [Erythranthe guttata]|eukprot:XP_012845995.1 PREDICTED: FBD-associated F-box protein At3g52670-like [Erythranthe guttata]